MEITKQDIIISGASYVGMSLACLLAKQNLKVTLLDSSTNNSQYNTQAHIPSRVFAIASASMKIFKDVGIDDQIILHSQPINQIFIEDYLINENIIFNPQDLDLQNFGFMIEEKYILDILTKEIKKYKNITVYKSCSIIRIINHPYNVEVKLLNNKSVISKLLIVSEGKKSKTRELAGINIKNKNYHQDAIVFNLKHEVNHQGVAVEKFLNSGPMAVLPKKCMHESCIVWIDKNGVGKILSSMTRNDATYIIQSKINNYLGNVKMISKIIYFPLHLTYAETYVSNKVILCGDSMHSIHPIAGQGLNLGLRDVKLLDELIKKYTNMGLDICSSNLLKEYNKRREFDVNLMIHATHNINSLFSNNLLPIKILRKIGLKVVNNSSLLKKYIMSYASGYKN